MIQILENISKLDPDFLHRNLALENRKHFQSCIQSIVNPLTGTLQNIPGIILWLRVRRTRMSESVPEYEGISEGFCFILVRVRSFDSTRIQIRSLQKSLPISELFSVSVELWSGFFWRVQVFWRIKEIYICEVDHWIAIMQTQAHPFAKCLWLAAKM